MIVTNETVTLLTLSIERSRLVSPQTGLSFGTLFPIFAPL